MVRLKHRYLLVHILYPHSQDNTKTKIPKSAKDAPYAIQFHRPSSDRLDARLLLQMIRNGVSELFGDYGSGMIAGSLQVKYCSPATSTAIIRVSRDHYRLVWAALTFTTRLPKPVDEPCVIQVVRVSGTIRKSEEAAVRLARLSITRAKMQASAGSGLAAQDTTGGARMKPRGENPAMEDGSGFEDGIEDMDEPGDDDDEDD